MICIFIQDYYALYRWLLRIGFLLPRWLVSNFIRQILYEVAYDAFRFPSSDNLWYILGHWNFMGGTLKFLQVPPNMNNVFQLVLVRLYFTSYVKWNCSIFCDIVVMYAHGAYRIFVTYEYSWLLLRYIISFILWTWIMT